MPTTQQAVRLAPAPRTDRRFEVSQILTEGFAGLARRLLRSVPDLDVHERQLIHDFKRPGEARYPMLPLAGLVAIAGRSPLAHHRFGAPEIIRAATIACGAPMSFCLVESLDQEDVDNAAFDTAVRRWEREGTEAARCAAVDAGERQLASTRTALDGLYAARPPRMAS